ncbi:hypothetical protein CHELA1G11_11168 [Hyphomicrobiales bacterium]|nr:hypothetical protein CHELA1G11_11168 [Hyphomicrobiales bacterium]CAH1669653.1 hypothetical protein CHELA1G2_13141 [Hyphomicrobiales bacterium]
MTAPGYRLVPEEPTQEMIDIGMDHTADPCWPDRLVKAYKAMLAAAPQPEPPADLVERADKAWINWATGRGTTPVGPEFLAAFAQEHAAVENKRIRDDALAALMDAEHDLGEARLDLAAEKARADKAEKALTDIVEQDVIEIALDPGWPQRIAAAAIRARKGGGDE